MRMLEHLSCLTGAPQRKHNTLCFSTVTRACLAGGCGTVLPCAFGRTHQLRPRRSRAALLSPARARLRGWPTSLPSMNAVGPVKGCRCTGRAEASISMPSIAQPARRAAQPGHTARPARAEAGVGWAPGRAPRSSRRKAQHCASEAKCRSRTWSTAPWLPKARKLRAPTRQTWRAAAARSERAARRGDAAAARRPCPVLCRAYSCRAAPVWARRLEQPRSVAEASGAVTPGPAPAPACRVRRTSRTPNAVALRAIMPRLCCLLMLCAMR